MDLSVNGGYASNPYLNSGSNSGTATFTASAQPYVTFRAPTSTTTIRGDVSQNIYSQTYADTTDYSVSGTSAIAISPITSVNANAGYSSQVQNTLLPVLNPIGGQPSDPNLPNILDPSAPASLARRVRTLNGGVSLQTALSPRDNLTFGVNGAQVRYPDQSVLTNSYDSLGGQLSYMRRISGATSIGLNFGASHHNYLGRTLGDGSSYSPSLVVQTKLAPRLELNLSGGLTFSDIDVIGGTIHQTSLSGSASLCRTGDRSHFCLQASRSVVPTSYAGVSRSTSAGVNYGYALTEHSSFSLHGNFVHSTSLQEASLQQGSDLHTNYLIGGAGYNRQIGRRLTATVAVNYSDSFNSSYSRGANVGATFGLRYRLGDTR